MFVTAPHGGPLQRYLQVCDRVAAEFARNRNLHGDRIHCRPGCSDCCHQLFQITEIEAAYISRAVAAFDSTTRERLQSRAREYIAERRRMVARDGEPEAWGNLPPPGTRLACPALEEGVCRIYEHRPLICRKFGMPLYNPAKPGRVFACELNFRDGEEIDDHELIARQSAIHDEWKLVQIEYNDANRPRDAEPLTVARALTEDFSGCAE
jgi:Fe-S-cluster containining protein